MPLKAGSSSPRKGHSPVQMVKDQTGPCWGNIMLLWVRDLEQQSRARAGARDVSVPSKAAEPVTPVSLSMAPECSREKRQELQVATVTSTPPPCAFTPGKICLSANTQCRAHDFHWSCSWWDYWMPRIGVEGPCRTSSLLLNLPPTSRLSLPQPKQHGWVWGSAANPEHLSNFSLLALLIQQRGGGKALSLRMRVISVIPISALWWICVFWRCRCIFFFFAVTIPLCFLLFTEIKGFPPTYLSKK